MMYTKRHHHAFLLANPKKLPTKLPPVLMEAREFSSTLHGRQKKIGKRRQKSNMSAEER